ncbi:cytoplasmic protein [Thermodesulfobacteriota bacterium]
MPKHSHTFVEEYNGLVGYGFNRETDEHTLTYYLQKFSDDKHMATILAKMSDSDMEELFNLLGRLLKKYLTEEEYHGQFLKDTD